MRLRSGTGPVPCRTVSGPASGTGRGRRRISTRSIRTIIQETAKAGGVEGTVLGHSLRVGSAQSVATAGATVVKMQQAGRGSPDQPGQYSRRQLAGGWAIACFRYGR